MGSLFNLTDKERELQRQKRIYGEMLRLIDTESKLREWRRNPDKWLVERLGESPKNIMWSSYPEYKGFSWDGTSDPLYKVFKAASDFDSATIQAGTSVGKTFQIARLVLWFLDCYPTDGLMITTAPTETQLKKQAWREIDRIWQKFLKIRPYAKKSSLSIKLDSRAGHEQSSEAIAFTTGYGASEEVATKAAGFHAPYMTIILEEAPGIPRAIVKALVATATSQTNNVIAFGNPDSPNDTLSYLKDTYSRFKNIRISGLDHPNIVVGREIIRGAITQQKVDDNLEAEDGDIEGFLYKSRIRGITPNESSSSLIKRGWVERQMLSTDRQLNDYSDIIDKKSKNGLGVDVAQSERGDKGSTIYSNHNVIVDSREFQCANASDLALNLIYDETEFVEIQDRKEMRNEIRNYNIPTISDYDIHKGCIMVDTTGIGASTANKFNEEGIEIMVTNRGVDLDKVPKQKKNSYTKDGRLEEKDEPLYVFKNFRAQLFWELAMDIRDGKLWFYIDSKLMRKQIITELTSIEFERINQKISVEEKKNIIKRIGKSPNVLDALAYCNWARKYGYKKKKRTFVHAIGGG